MDARPASVTVTSPSAGTPEGPDERLATISRLTRALQRPELGALLGAVAVFALFAATDSTPQHLWLTQTGVAAWSRRPPSSGSWRCPWDCS
jgi:hypothetical protein